MRTKVLINLIRIRLADVLAGPLHECEQCSELDYSFVHMRLSTGDVVCWRCAERAGELPMLLPEKE